MTRALSRRLDRLEMKAEAADLVPVLIVLEPEEDPEQALARHLTTRPEDEHRPVLLITTGVVRRVLHCP